MESPFLTAVKKEQVHCKTSHAVFFHHVYATQGQTINQYFCLQVLGYLCGAVHCKLSQK